MCHSIQGNTNAITNANANANTNTNTNANTNTYTNTNTNTNTNTYRLLYDTSYWVIRWSISNAVVESKYIYYFIKLLLYIFRLFFISLLYITLK